MDLWVFNLLLVKYFAVGSEGESDLDLLVNSRHLETCRSLILDCLVHLSPFDRFVGTVNDYLFGILVKKRTESALKVT